METETLTINGTTRTVSFYKSHQQSVPSPPPFFNSPVDVLIPYHCQYLRVRDCVESILLNSKTSRMRITLIDDGSPNTEFVPLMKKMAPVEYLRLKERQGFGAALDLGFRATDLPWVCVIHSDCKVGTQDWLARMGQSLLALKKDGVRMVHSRTDNPAGEFRVLRPSQQADAHHDTPSDEPLPLICAMFHRDLFARIGGFVKAYPTAGYEDTELFYRMKAGGHRQAVCGSCWVKHHGGATVNDVVARDPSVKAVMEANYDRCRTDIAALRGKIAG